MAIHCRQLIRHEVGHDGLDPPTMLASMTDTGSDIMTTERFDHFSCCKLQRLVRPSGRFYAALNPWHVTTYNGLPEIPLRGYTIHSKAIQI